MIKNDSPEKRQRVRKKRATKAKKNLAKDAKARKKWSAKQTRLKKRKGEDYSSTIFKEPGHRTGVKRKVHTKKSVARGIKKRSRGRPITTKTKKSKPISRRKARS